MTKNADAFPRTLRGFSFVEVLVAVFVMSVGLLGVGALQVTSKRSNLEAVQRATAVALASDIIERMRANAQELAAYSNGGTGFTLTGSTMSQILCSTNCTPEQLAAYDLHEFERALGGAAEKSGSANVGGLVTPTACVTGPNGISGVYTIAIAWRGTTKLSNPTLHSCGATSGRYDAVSGGVTEADVYRRLFVMQTYVSRPI